MKKSEKVPILSIFSPKTILMFRVGFKKNRVVRPTGTTHTFHLSLRYIACLTLHSHCLNVMLNCSITKKQFMAAMKLSFLWQKFVDCIPLIKTLLIFLELKLFNSL